MDCSDCSLPKQYCICWTEVLPEASDDYLEDLDEATAAKAPGASRCVGCFFFSCRCRAGLRRK